ncbi:hypothetical protein [Alteribacillus sp. HJP-4]|uniref:hypothetical protein n=1 Tax=Alteribacillus sp. HJP-4 TaxID=2775394 RepID=UPI0035CCED79
MEDYYNKRGHMKPDDMNKFLETFDDPVLRKQLENMLKAVYRQGYEDGKKARQQN